VILFSVETFFGSCIYFFSPLLLKLMKTGRDGIGGRRERVEVRGGGRGSALVWIRFQVDVRIDPCMFFTLHVQKSSVLRCARKYLFSCLSEPNCSQGACLHACSAKYFLIVYNFPRSFDQSDFLSHLLSIIMQASCFVKLRVPNTKTNRASGTGKAKEGH